MLALLFLYQGIQLNAQEQWGLRLGSAAGVNGLLLNPASGLSGSYDMDITLFSGAVFLENNYAFLRDQSLLSLAVNANSEKWVVSYEYDESPQSYPNAIVFDFKDDARKRYLYGSASTMAPSGLIRLPGGHSLGWVVQGRVAASGQGVPNNLSYFKYDRRPDLEPFSVHRWEMGILSWGEIGLHYGRQWETSNGTFNAGVVAKYLAGWEGIYFRNNVDLDAYTKITGDTIAGEKMDLLYGYTRTNLGAPPFQLIQNGAGFGMDIGVEWTQDGDFDPYQWKLGISLLDLGAIQFNQNAASHHAVSNEPEFVPNVDYGFVQSPEDLDEVVRLFSYQTLGDSAASLAANDFTLWMPTAFSVQFELGVTPSLWLHGGLVQRIPHPGIAVQRGNSLMLGARFEKRWIAAGVPLTVYNLDEVRLGFFFRAGPLVMGTDHFPAYFIGGRLSGADFYCALHWPFNLSLGSGRSKGFVRLKNGKVKCPTF